eukprot:COSAG06_NODE_71240_length_186_cov_41.413793_1_plen_61_part_11
MSELRVHSLIVLSDHSCLGKKTPFVSPFYTKNVHVYQDRLGTNIGKAALKKRMMRLLTGGG